MSTIERLAQIEDVVVDVSDRFFLSFALNPIVMKGECAEASRDQILIDLNVMTGGHRSCQIEPVIVEVVHAVVVKLQAVDRADNWAVVIVRKLRIRKLEIPVRRIDAIRNKEIG